MRNEGLVHIYTGDGKGKTTAAVGLAVRAVGAGWKVLIVQFLKGMDTSELVPLRSLGVMVRRGRTEKFIPFMAQNELSACREEQERLFNELTADMEKFDLVILDEILSAVSAGMIPKSAVIRLIREKRREEELVLTGRDAPADLIELADYVSDIRCVRHPYEHGVRGRKGIEF